MSRFNSRIFVVSAALMTSLGLTIRAGAQAPAVQGQWGPVFDWGPSEELQRPIHLVLLKTGKILSFKGLSQFPKVLVYDPSDGSFLVLPNPRNGMHRFTNIVCSGHSQLPDGRILLVGGGSKYEFAHAWTVIFDPALIDDDPWITDMDGLDELPGGKRWYPTCTTLGDGRVLVLAGDDNALPPHTADIPAIFDADQPTGFQYVELPLAEMHLRWYPFTFQFSSGDVFYGGTHYYFAIQDPNDPTKSEPVPSLMLNTTLGIWSSAGTSVIKGGSAVMYRPDKVMKAGGGLHSSQKFACRDNPITNRATVFDPTIANWTDIAAMQHRRIHFYLLVLPDGQVLAVGGAGADPNNDWKLDCDIPVLTPELYDPDTNAWSPMAPMTDPRQYHSVAVLLPDGRVLLAGGEVPDDQMTGQIFSPPYLFQGARPVIDSAPDEINYGASFTINTTDAAAITSVCLIRPGSATHSYDFDQRYVPLVFTDTASMTLSAAAPAHAFQAPPGYYMLFIVKNGVPSVSKMIQLSPASSP